ncbi:MAG: long-chain-fatty-acid--CoA ligase [Xanthomonadales bacterium]|jgi:fatty-acyl-CoA synthase|nr:long-chain-fatty-acid--CoA ligase [Xanthomonadales bacterium]MDH3941415.1 long-chain-fatty-acid--CoA ligase [Xanthomonadales bacterium]MDH4000942.1 long-chain-fatty-acid--CoA ligase [Xanthomonadales bacterium]
MLGLMQDYPLLVHTILDHGALNHGERELVTRSVEGPIRRTTLAEIRERALRVAKALHKEGIKQGDRVATMAWNTERHMEAWFGIMGHGAVCHTLNPRLFAEQLDYIVNHAEDRIIFVDTTFLPIMEALKDRFASVEKYIVLTDSDHMPATSLPNVVAYEDWIAAVDADYRWQKLDENSAAALCYTSGTTGNPKGVLYSHRSNVLHGLMVNQPDVFGLRSEDSVLAIVPMFHANAWALTFAVPASGAKMVMPGAGMDGKSIYELLENEKVSCTAAVPTVWLGLLQYLEQTGKKLPYLNRVVVGGAACPPMMIRKFELDFDVEVIHGWGMTEMSPVGTTGKMKHATSVLDRESQLKLKEKQGRTPFLVEMKTVNDEGEDLPRDGKTSGHLLVKGPCVSSGYFKLDEPVLTADGWFNTGDIATIDPLGFMQITDRDKDVIKSGGEWISSIEVENVAVGCPGVAEAAVIGLPHPKWSERPLLIIVKEADAELDDQSVLAYLDGKIAKWWMPDDVVFVEEIPHTATGKIQKMELRSRFSDFEFSS